MIKFKHFSKSIAVIMLIITIFSTLVIPASAATSGGKSSATIYVTSKANYWYPGASSITLQQSKQTATYGQFTSNKTKKTTDYFGYYNITIYNITKGKYEKDQIWDGTKTKKIELPKNCNFKITVKYNSTATVSFNVRTPSIAYNNYKGITNPSWWVSSTHKVSSCY